MRWLFRIKRNETEFALFHRFIHYLRMLSIYKVHLSYPLLKNIYPPNPPPPQKKIPRHYEKLLQNKLNLAWKDL